MAVATARTAPSARTHDPDLWHVAIAPGETKVLSLEQLDDFFRLEIIDASTRVWQPGMSDWLPLSVVAGIEDEPASAAPARPAPPPPPSRSRPAPPPPPKPQPYAATVPVATGAQPIWAIPTAPAAAQPIWATPAPAPAFSAPESLRPIVLNDVPLPEPKSGGGAGRFLIGLALVASLGVTLYRNDVLRQAARSVDRESAYLRLEAALGSPGFGTPRAVEHLMASSLALPEPGTLPLAPSVPVTTTATTAAVATTATAAPVATTAPSPARAADEPASAKSETQKPPSLETLVAAQVGGGTKRRVEAPAAPQRKPRASAPSSAPEKSLGIKGSTHRFDPLNGKL